MERVFQAGWDCDSVGGKCSPLLSSSFTASGGTPVLLDM